ncbi:agmatine deiminase [Enterococcus sp. AZ163]|uniref:agmatine deiminase n=1 Tax=Enterococcus sp. AZ163 TaxID=2774638 RepID=UPI003D2BAC5B
MAKTISSTPQKDGFRMPGEFEPQAGIWTGWPLRPDVWRANARPAQQTMLEVIKAIAKFEQVTVICTEAYYDYARTALPEDENIRLIEMSYDDCWLRDCGTTFVVNDKGALRGVDWDFNAWGGLEEGFYFPWDKDDKVAKKMLEIENKDRYKAPFVLEGGSIHSDGEGTILTTEECLLEHNSNPEMGKEEYTEALKDYLGAEKVIWIPKGIAYDSVYGHVDNIACFAKPGVILMSWTDDEADEQYAISREVYEFLSKQTDAKGRNFEIHKITQPNPIFYTKEEAESYNFTDTTTSYVEGDRIAASYINFLIVNGGIIYPTFDDEEQDAEAKRKLEEVFPGREVVGVMSRELIMGGGNIHCMTQQQPKV